MGNNGSMFLGFLLAELAIARRTQASNVFAALGVPTLIMLLPISRYNFCDDYTIASRSVAHSGWNRSYITQVDRFWLE